MIPLLKTTDRTVSDRFVPITFYLKSRISMRYDVSKATAPAMPNLGKGAECI